MRSLLVRSFIMWVHAGWNPFTRGGMGLLHLAAARESIDSLGPQKAAQVKQMSMIALIARTKNKGPVKARYSGRVGINFLDRRIFGYLHWTTPMTPKRNRSSIEYCDAVNSLYISAFMHCVAIPKTSISEILRWFQNITMALLVYVGYCEAMIYSRGWGLQYASLWYLIVLELSNLQI